MTRCVASAIKCDSTNIDMRLQHCDTLRHTATHCDTLRHTATHCNNTATTLQQHCNNAATTPILPRPAASHLKSAIKRENANLDMQSKNIAVRCNTLRRTATHCNILQHAAPLLRCDQVWCIKHLGAGGFHEYSVCDSFPCRVRDSFYAEYVTYSRVELVTHSWSEFVNYSMWSLWLIVV